MPQYGYGDMPGSVDTVTEYARPVRGWAYVLLFFFSFMTLVFTVVRMAYTLGDRGGDKFLNDGKPFYETVVMEMAVVSLMTIIWAIFLIFLLRTEKKSGFLSRNWFEAVALGALWMLWIGGAAGSTSIWPDLNFCVQFSQCRILQAMMAWMWLGWIVITFLLIPMLYFSITRDCWAGRVYDGWQPEAETSFTTQTKSRRTKNKKKGPVEVSAPIMPAPMPMMTDDPYELSAQQVQQQQMVDQWLLGDPRPDSIPVPAAAYNPNHGGYATEDSVRHNLRGYS